MTSTGTPKDSAGDSTPTTGGHLEIGAIVAVTVQDADDGDTTTSIETLIEAAERVEAVRPNGDGIEEVVGDKGYHSNQSLVDLEAVGVRSYIAEPDRGRRNWKKNPEASGAVYRNRRRVRGARGLRLLRLRAERLERPFAHLYETGGLRRVHVRGHTNILKRLLIHTGGFNLGLLMRQLIGVGTPRGLQGRLIVISATLLLLTWCHWESVMRRGQPRRRVSAPERRSIAGCTIAYGGVRNGFHHGLGGVRKGCARAMTHADLLDAEAEDSLWTLRAAADQVADGGDDAVEAGGIGGGQREAQRRHRLALFNRLELQLAKHRAIGFVDRVVDVHVAAPGIGKTAAHARDREGRRVGAQLGDRVERHTGTPLQPRAQGVVFARCDDEIRLECRGLTL